jgi:hypothetical protein
MVGHARSLPWGQCFGLLRMLLAPDIDLSRYEVKVASDRVVEETIEIGLVEEKRHDVLAV